MPSSSSPTSSLSKEKDGGGGMRQRIS
jgi:hypothetical protein